MITFKCFRTSFARKFSTKIKPKIAADEGVLNNIGNNVYKPRNHPGILKPRVITIPDHFTKAVVNVTADFPVKAIIEDGKLLSRHLQGKMPPVEKEEAKKLNREVKERVVSSMKMPKVVSEEQLVKLEQVVNNKVSMLLKQKIYNWKAVNYDNYNCLVYLLTRSAGEYAVLVKIFSEINERDPGFKPRSLFDFGSGVGTVTWAANTIWEKSIFEYFNVDSSADMNDLAQLLLQNGRGTTQITLKGVFYRQFLPASNTAFDLVVSAYSLLELPSRQSRLETILNLWNKTQKYLVIIEQGTSAGFEIVNEVRDFILHTKNNKTVGHVFSPCPHDEACPRFLANDGTPCNFEIHYFSLPVGAVSQRKSERYSYVVLKKSVRDLLDPQWPRVVRETLVRSKHTVCRMCTKNAQLQEVIFTASKHGKNLYHCARATKWGDLVPVSLENKEEED